MREILQIIGYLIATFIVLILLNIIINFYVLIIKYIKLKIIKEN